MTIDYLTKIRLPPEAQAVVRKLYGRFQNDGEYLAFDDRMRSGESFPAIKKDLSAFAAARNIHPYELQLALLVTSLDHMHRQYENAGLEKTFRDGVRDLGCKVNECINTYGVWGVEPFDWYQLFYEAKRLVFGRLQYDPVTFEYPAYSFGGRTLNTGDSVYTIHIPSDGRLDPRAVQASLRQAYEFLKEEQNPVCFTCVSWLLYPAYQERVFRKGSNLCLFADLFEIIDEKPLNTFYDGWRVFHTKDLSDPDSLPQDTALRRDFVRYLKNGGAHGYAAGLLIYDENGPCNRKQAQ